jgi:hypothetical protein
VSGKSRDVVRRAEALSVALQALTTVLIDYQSAVPDLISRVERGDKVAEAVQGVGAATIRSDVTDALDAFESARHEFRKAVVALGLEQGSSASEVGRAFGFSRQLASRLATEIDNEHP